MINRFKTELLARNKSESCIKSYTYSVGQFLSIVSRANKTAETITADDLKKYQVWLMEKKKYSSRSINNRMYGIKAFYKTVLGIDFLSVPAMKEPKTQPEYFTESEIEQIVDTLQNKKHKLAVMLTYDAGLRLQETICIRVPDIDLSNKTIHIRSAKGNRDRRVSFGEYTKSLIIDYIQKYEISDIGYLFESQDKKGHWSKKSFQNVLKDVCEYLNIRGRHNVHKLRHSFGTNSIINGQSVFHVQALLGHKSIKTTMIYAHVANDALKAETPFDRLKNNKDVQDNRNLYAISGV